MSVVVIKLKSLIRVVGYDNKVTKLGQDATKSVCLLRFEINGASGAENLENFAMFPYRESGSILQLRDRESKHVKRLRLQKVKVVYQNI